MTITALPDEDGYRTYVVSRDGKLFGYVNGRPFKAFGDETKEDVQVAAERWLAHMNRQ